MTSSNTRIAEKSMSAVSSPSRREVGKRDWKAMINELIDSERADLEDLRALKRRLTDAESLRLVAELLDRKTERVIELTLLLRYRDSEKEKAHENGGG